MDDFSRASPSEVADEQTPLADNLGRVPPRYPPPSQSVRLARPGPTLPN
jgi:hypothetical protein